MRKRKGIWKKWILLALILTLLLPNTSLANSDTSVTGENESNANLVAHYSFDGDLTDETGLADEGKVTGEKIDQTGGKITFEEGKHGQAAVFDGASGVRLPDGLISSYQYSVSLWLNPAELTNFTTSLFGARTDEDWISLLPGGNDHNETGIWSKNGTERNPEWFDAVIGSQIPVNEWTHVAFTVNNGETNVYIDGQNKFSGKMIADIFTTENGVFSLGVNYWDTPYKGLMDELLIYNNIVLTEADIQQYYETGEIPEGSAASEEAEPEKVGDGPEFSNVSVHDPSIIKDKDTYYVFGSHIEAAKSTDLLNWTSFANGYKTPDNALYGDLSANLAESFKWAGEDDSDSKGGFAVWAPEIFWNEHYVHQDGSKGAYMMYYSASSTYIRSAIGFAVSKEIEGPYEYVDTVMYSGFSKEEAYDENSEVNKKWTNTNIKNLVDEGVIQGERSEWFNNDGSFNNFTFPNAIDANLFYDQEGKLWMTYGSWSGGIFILEVNPETGLPIYPGEDGMTEDGRLIDRYFGTKISGGFGKSGEGPYVVYDPETNYYFLYVTYGWLEATGEYNMRVFRSENPEGPYLDSLGQDAVLKSNTDHSPLGNKLLGHFLFEREEGDPGTGIGYGYMSSGHNSVYLDRETGEHYLVFHTRFPQQGEMHELRIHQMFMNEDNWPVVAPYRYTGEKLEKVDNAGINGDYLFVNHEKDISNELKTAVPIQLEQDGTISGSVEGNWELKDDYYAHVTIDGHLYKGVFLRQWNEVTETEEMVFTAQSEEGKSIWGIKTIEQKDDGANENVSGDTQSEDAESNSVVMILIIVLGIIIVAGGLFAYYVKVRKKRN